MRKSEGDILADNKPAIDRGESVTLMEPLLIAAGAGARDALHDLALDLATRSAGFHRSLPLGVMHALAELVRAMNCYYSNLIEGHDTHPIEIERALKQDYSRDPRQRSLQREAEAHIAVQAWIDTGGINGRETTQDGLCEIHRRFCELLPEDLLLVEDSKSRKRVRVMPGEFRRRDVQVGLHQAISPGAVPRFLSRLETAHSTLGSAGRLLNAAAAHHRLLWIHPFLDGNGRVARLMSYAQLRDSRGTGGVWSVARGLARNVQAYKQHLAACDQQRRNDLDGRGHLSEEALVAFTRFFLEICIDQVDFMEKLVNPETLHGRILRWADEEAGARRLPSQARKVLEAILYRGELPRADVPALLGTSDRQARRVTGALQKTGALQAASDRDPFRLAFTATLASRWLPGLFPEQ